MAEVGAPADLLLGRLPEVHSVEPSIALAVAGSTLTIKAADDDSSPVIDATGFEVGVLIDANGVTVKGLTARNATLGGLDLAYAFEVLGDDNTLEIGIFAFDNSLLTLKENIAFENRDGFQINGNFETSAKENEAFANDRHGYVIAFGENGSSFKENKAYGNGDYGFFIFQELLDNEFKENECSGNGLGGSNVDGICD